MADDIRGIWRGKMNRNLYESFLYVPLQLPRYAGRPVNDPSAPTIWFGLKISSQFDYFAEKANFGRLMVISGEAGHYSNSELITLPVTGFFDAGIGTVRLTFYYLYGPASFLGSFTDDNHIVGDWTNTRQWNDWTGPTGWNINSFWFGKMSLQKIISFKDRADLVTVKHLFLP